MHTLTLIACVLLQSDEGKALYDRMAKALDDAKALTWTAKASIESDPLKLGVEASLKLKPAANKAALDATLAGRDRKERVALTCDGTSCAESVGDAQKPATEAPKDLAARLLAGAKAIGLAGMLWPAAQPAAERRNRNEAPDFAGGLELKDFALKGGEKVGERAAKVLTYTVTVKAGASFAAKVWIDDATGLPLKRELEGEYEKAKLKITETCEVGASDDLPDSAFAVKR